MDKIEFNQSSLIFQLLLSDLIEVQMENSREYLDKNDVENLIQFLNLVKDKLN